ncbi:unnamed protein product [Ectocarpus sp. 8 AP-2014]
MTMFHTWPGNFNDRDDQRTRDSKLLAAFAYEGRQRGSGGGGVGDDGCATVRTVLDRRADISASMQDCNSSKEWTPFFSSTGEMNDPSRVVAHAPAAALIGAKPRASPTTASALSRKLLPRALARTSASSRRPTHQGVQVESESDNENDAEVAFSVPPNVKAVLRRCAAQGRDRVAGGTAAGCGRGTPTAQPAVAAAAATPSVTPTVTLSRCEDRRAAFARGEQGDGSRFSAAGKTGGGNGSGGDGVTHGGSDGARGLVTGCDDLNAEEGGVGVSVHHLEALLYDMGDESTARRRPSFLADMGERSKSVSRMITTPFRRIRRTSKTP